MFSGHVQVHRQSLTIGQAWEEERQALHPLLPFDYQCCQTATVRLTPYSQAIFETNRYSVPTKRARREVTVKAYPFHVEILDGTSILARHARCYGREQDIFDPFHYLPLQKPRPGAFDYAKPLKRWREQWPESYTTMLTHLRTKWPEGRGVQESVTYSSASSRLSCIIGSTSHRASAHHRVCSSGWGPSLFAPTHHPSP